MAALQSARPCSTVDPLDSPLSTSCRLVDFQCCSNWSDDHLHRSVLHSACWWRESLVEQCAPCSFAPLDLACGRSSWLGRTRRRPQRWTLEVFDFVIASCKETIQSTIKLTSANNVPNVQRVDVRNTGHLVVHWFWASHWYPNDDT